jgi:ketosteroid isomerase-like protein
VQDFVLAEAGIRQLHARCADAIWRKDAEALGDCFAQDAEWQLSAGPRRGRAAIVEIMRAGFGSFRRVLMTFRTPLLEVGDGVAGGRTYVTEDGVRADGTPYLLIGTYLERFACEADGRWRFTWRRFQPLYSGPHDLSGSFLDVPDQGLPPGAGE